MPVLVLMAVAGARSVAVVTAGAAVARDGGAEVSKQRCSIPTQATGDRVDQIMGWEAEPLCNVIPTTTATTTLPTAPERLHGSGLRRGVGSTGKTSLFLCGWTVWPGLKS